MPLIMLFIYFQILRERGHVAADQWLHDVAVTTGVVVLAIVAIIAAAVFVL